MESSAQSFAAGSRLVGISDFVQFCSPSAGQRKVTALAVPSFLARFPYSFDIDIDWILDFGFQRRISVC